MALKLTFLGFLVYAVMAIYLAAAVAYWVRQRRLGGVLYALGFAVAVVTFGVRWYEVNHVPLQNMFEVCLCLGMLMWPITFFCRRFLGLADEASDAIIGFIILVPAGFVFKAEPQHLPPALQSALFIPHVASYMLAYVVMAKAAVQAIRAFEWRTQLALLVLVVHRVGLVLAFSLPKVFVYLADLLGAAPPKETMWWLPVGSVQIAGMPDLSDVLAYLLMALQWFLMPAMTGLYQLTGGHWNGWVILGALSDVVVYVPIVALLAIAKPLPLERQTSREQGAYRVSALGFPLLTLGLVLGAVWGKIAWGDYWNWDPKELWSLVSWLVYLGYFHLRYMQGQRLPRVNSAIVLVGLLMIILTLLWVNLATLFKGGMHSYAS